MPTTKRSPAPPGRQEPAAKRPAPELPTHIGGLELWMAPGSQTGYRCVTRSSTSTTRPYEVRASHNGRKEHLGSFETAPEAAYCFACYKKGLPHTMPPTAAAPSASRQSSKLPPPLTREEALQLASAEGLNLLRDPSTVSGYRGVSFSPADSGSRPFRVRITWRGREEFIGSYRTVEEAALRYARRIQKLQHDGAVPPTASAARITLGGSGGRGGGGGGGGEGGGSGRPGGSGSRRRLVPSPTEVDEGNTAPGKPTLEGRRSANVSTKSTASSVATQAGELTSVDTSAWSPMGSPRARGSVGPASPSAGPPAAVGLLSDSASSGSAEESGENTVTPVRAALWTALCRLALCPLPPRRPPLAVPVPKALALGTALDAPSRPRPPLATTPRRAVPRHAAPRHPPELTLMHRRSSPPRRSSPSWPPRASHSSPPRARR